MLCNFNSLATLPVLHYFLFVGFFSIAMSEKEEKKKTIKKKRKATKDKKPITLRLNDGIIVNANIIFKESARIFQIKSFTAKSTTHISIMYFMNIIMNTLLLKFFFQM